jgi:hypothetical protein
MDMYSAIYTDVAKGKEMIRGVLTAISDHFTRRLWEARNRVLHDKHNEETRAIQSAEILEVNYYFNRPRLLVSFDNRHFCERSLQALLTAPSSTCHRWLRRVKNSVQAQLDNGSSQSLITLYFSNLGRA